MRIPAPPDILLHHQRALGLAHKRRPRIHVPVLRDGLRAVGIVHAKQRGLREDVSSAQARRMLVVAFDLRRPPQVAFHQHGTRVSAQRHGRRVKLRPPRNDVLGLLHVRHDRLERQLGAAGHAGHRQRRPHQLQESAPRHRLHPLRSSFRKFAVQHLLKFRSARQFFQAAPVFRPGRLPDLRFHGRAIQLLARANDLASTEPAEVSSRLVFCASSILISGGVHRLETPNPYR